MPESSLRRSLTPLEAHPLNAVVDAHNHLGRWMTGGWPEDVSALLTRMDALGIDAVVNLDGMWGEELEANLDRYDRAHAGRFVTFARWDGAAFEEGEWRALGRGVAESFARGARGLKVWKDLGLHLRDGTGELVMPDDERLDPVWDAVAEAKVPVTIHVADPIAFFAPLDERNERLEELLAHPDWWFGDRSRFPTFERIRDSLESLVARRSDVSWIGAHTLSSAEDLAWVERVLETYPNVHADIGARIAELGRVPRAARDLILRHSDRFLFATDDIPAAVPDTLAVYRRFLETFDEHFPYDPDPNAGPTQGRWAISGLGLPSDVLEKVYARNARRLIPGLAG
jgi:predicted TIM-barrel fold metal-dependent hydrolase